MIEKMLEKEVGNHFGDDIEYEAKFVVMDFRTQKVDFLVYEWIDVRVTKYRV